MTPDSQHSSTRRPPAVSIVLPTFNRASFLGSALESIREQSFTDWELIIVDDGSTDGTSDHIAGLTAGLGDRVRYVRQANKGAYAARNAGIRYATGQYVAFFDSDDLWLPHHLETCCNALDSAPRVDWVYGACRVVDIRSHAVIRENTFYDHGQPRAFLRLNAEQLGRLRVIDDPGILYCTVWAGLQNGLQNSVMRRSLFRNRRFDERYRVIEDQLFVIRLVADGHRFAYFDDVHAIYQVHGDHSSTPSVNGTIPISVAEETVTGLTDVRATVRLSRAERRQLTRRIAHEYFWILGYQGYRPIGRITSAQAAFETALRLWPWSVSRWKTYLLFRARSCFPGLADHV